MKSAIATVLFASLAAAAPVNPTSSAPEHNLRTFTNQDGYTLLIDEANTELGGLEVGVPGIDGIYNNNFAPTGSAQGTDTWVDVHDGVQAVIDYAHPNFYTVYDSQSSPIETVSFSYPESQPTEDASHYMMTFVNQEGVTLLIDQAVSNAAILEVGQEGIDGIYTVPPEGVPTETASGTDTWIDSVNGYIAVIDYAHPNHYTVYDSESSPIQTISY
ncbi:hypothetical protein IWW56_005741 [Coemansia sp. RSA 2131]|nr:hypothetical protein IWW56_005741 [Coemansia sp. RSA 2131]